MDERDPSPRAISFLLLILMVGMPIFGLVPKYFIIHRLFPPEELVFGDYAFGGYLDSLIHSGQFRECRPLPFTACSAGTCGYATRMPVVPVLLAGIAKIVGTHTVPVAIVKVVLTSLLSCLFLAVLSLDIRLSLWQLALLYGLYFGPQALKHAVSIGYEDAVFVDLMLCFGIAASYLLRPDLTSSGTRRNIMAVTAVALACLMYFSKPTVLPLLMVTLALALATRHLPWTWKAASVLLVAAPMALWASHTLKTGGTMRLSASYNGENLFRGYNSYSLLIYPQVNLDRIFDSTAATLADGTRVPIRDTAHQDCFSDEWAWNDHYAAAARAWLWQHPVAALKFLAIKAWFALVDVRFTPGRMNETGAAVGAAAVAWMVFARCVLFALVIALAGQILHRRYAPALWALALVGAAFTPFVIVFAYQRHVVPLLILAGTLLITLFAGRRTAA